MYHHFAVTFVPMFRTGFLETQGPPASHRRGEQGVVASKGAIPMGPSLHIVKRSKQKSPSTGFRALGDDFLDRLDGNAEVASLQRRPTFIRPWWL